MQCIIYKSRSRRKEEERAKVEMFCQLLQLWGYRRLALRTNNPRNIIWKMTNGEVTIFCSLLSSDDYIITTVESADICDALR